MSEENPRHRIVIEFAAGDSIVADVKAEGVHPNQFFAAAKHCELLGVEYWQRQRVQQMMEAEAAQQKSAIEVARSFPGVKN